MSEWVFPCKGYLKTSLDIAKAFNDIATKYASYQIKIDWWGEKDFIKVFYTVGPEKEIVKSEFEGCLPIKTVIKQDKRKVNKDLLEMITNKFKGTHVKNYLTGNIKV